jgi:hypothetical protein
MSASEKKIELPGDRDPRWNEQLELVPLPAEVAKRGIKGDVEYLRILHLAASTMESDVEQALVALLADGLMVTADATKKMRTQSTDSDSLPTVPALESPPVDLASYDMLLAEVAS